MATPEERKHYEESARWAEDMAASASATDMEKVEERAALAAARPSNKAPSQANSRPRKRVRSWIRTLQLG